MVRNVFFALPPYSILALPDDLLVLQLKESHPSVIEEVYPLHPRLAADHGERVVTGIRQLQSSSDVFLGYSSGMPGGRKFYWRQLKDMKGGVEVEELNYEQFVQYAKICGLTLAR